VSPATGFWVIGWMDVSAAVHAAAATYATNAIFRFMVSIAEC
jgi:hypothetical protein